MNMLFLSLAKKSMRPRGSKDRTTKEMRKYWKDTVTEIASPRMGSVIERSELGSIAIHTEMIAVAINERIKLKLYQDFVSSILKPSKKRILIHRVNI